MAIPDFKSCLLPVLLLAGDGQEHSIREAYEVIPEQLKLTDSERRQLLPSGKQTVIENRIGWAKTYLVKAGLLESPRRAVFRITNVGVQVLAEKPKQLDPSFLRKFPGFVEFFRGRQASADPEDAALDSSDETPQELLEIGYQQIRRDLADELLGHVRRAAPSFFERLVVELLVRMGYGGSLKDAGEAVGRSGDGGIDGIIKEDRLGLDAIYIQAKRFGDGNPVGAKDVRDFVGSLVGKKASKGVFITSSSFTKDAKHYIKTIGHNVILIDAEMLANLMIDFGVGVSTVSTYEVKKVDADYFVEE